MSSGIKEYVLHDHTRHDIEQFVTAPAHGLLLVGLQGAGKPTLARAVVADALGLPIDKLQNHNYFLHITPEKQSIPIEAIRNAQQFVRLRTTGEQPLRRALIIEDAHAMTVEAQNAFLKLLEEPPVDTIILMTAHSKDGLLPTILSRTQKITVKSPSLESLQAYFTQHGYNETEITKAYYMSKGQPGLMTRILSEEDNPALGFIDTAKKILGASTFDRLVMVDKLAKAKDELPQLLWALQRVADSALYQASQKNNSRQVAYWQKVLKSVLQYQKDLSANPQPKLLLTALMLDL